MVIDHLIKNLVSLGLSVVFRRGNEKLWITTFNNLRYRPVAYSNDSLNYQYEYQQGHGGSWSDLSLIINWDRKSVALWPLSYSEKDGQSRFTSQGGSVMPPIFIQDCPLVTQKRIIQICLQVANSIATFTGEATWESGESFREELGLSFWHSESMARGAKCSIKHELYLDISKNFVDIKKNFRKSYKSLITSGSKLWGVNILESANEEVWSNFRKLHLQVSGRDTRTDETWKLQHQQLIDGSAFLVWLANNSGCMVGGGLFSYTVDEGLYAVAAYDRALFDKPMGHVVQYRAIEELKKKGVRWYKIGNRPYASDCPIPSKKEISIAEFKQGFSSHIFPQYKIMHQVSLIPV